ncbi:MAG: M81 family metallopeptidase [Chloroflexota bacterium]|nr:M81 family metallopeptidase [Chloroflexota bacterium]
MPPRLALAGLRHLTNRFTSGQTGLDTFAPLLRGEDLSHPTAGPVLSAVLAGSPGQVGWEPVPILAAAASPGGPVTLEAFNAITAELTAGLQRTRPDALLLDLPGTTILEDGIAGEAAIVARARETLGPMAPIVVTSSLLSTFTDRLVGVADVVLLLEDSHSRRSDFTPSLLTTLGRVLNGRVNPTSVTRKLPLLVVPDVVRDHTEAMDGLLELIRETQQVEGVVHAGLAFGFAYADSPDAGTDVVLVTDGDHGLAERLADDLAAAVWSRRHSLQPSTLTVEEAVHAAMSGSAGNDSDPGEAGGPLVLLDGGDDLRGGAPGDGTALLWALLDLGAPDALFALLVDPAAVASAFAAGVGTSLELPLGAASGEEHGFPIDVIATVGALACSDANRTTPSRGTGRTAVLRCEGRYGQAVEVVVGERCPVAGERDLFGPLGVDPMTHKILALKPGTPWSSRLQPVRLLRVDTPGPTRLNLADLPFRHVPRPIWPLDPIPNTPGDWGDR